MPTFGAYDLAAWKLMLQAPASLATILLAKGLTLMAGWLLAWTPGLLALVLWKAYGGSLYAPETLNLLLGHLLRAILSTGVAVAAAAIATGAASAAIATLGFTVGTWVVSRDVLEGGLVASVVDIASLPRASWPAHSSYYAAAGVAGKEGGLDNGRRHVRSRCHAYFDCLPVSDVLGNGGTAAGGLRHRPHHADSTG